MSYKQVQRWTDKDPVLSKVCQYLLQGWPSESSDVVKPFQQQREELSVQNGCVLCGSCVVIPFAGQKVVTDIIHKGHPEARSYV